MKIALIGKMCSGKSTIANYLKNNYNYKILSFGQPVKQYATEIFGLKNKNRAIIQDFAQKVREIDDEVWIKYLIRKYREENYSNIVVDDVRFPKELKALKQEGFVIIKINITKEFQIERIKNTYIENYENHIDRTNDISESYIEQLSAEYSYDMNKNTEKLIYNFIENILQMDCI